MDSQFQMDFCNGHRFTHKDVPPLPHSNNPSHLYRQPLLYQHRPFPLRQATDRFISILLLHPRRNRTRPHSMRLRRRLRLQLLPPQLRPLALPLRPLPLPPLQKLPSHRKPRHPPSPKYPNRNGSHPGLFSRHLKLSSPTHLHPRVV